MIMSVRGAMVVVSLRTMTMPVVGVAVPVVMPVPMMAVRMMVMRVIMAAMMVRVIVHSAPRYQRAHLPPKQPQPEQGDDGPARALEHHLGCPDLADRPAHDEHDDAEDHNGGERLHERRHEGQDHAASHRLAVCQQV